MSIFIAFFRIFFSQSGDNSQHYIKVKNIKVVLMQSKSTTQKLTLQHIKMKRYCL